MKPSITPTKESYIAFLSLIVPAINKIRSTALGVSLDEPRLFDQCLLFEIENRGYIDHREYTKYTPVIESQYAPYVFNMWVDKYYDYFLFYLHIIKNYPILIGDFEFIVTLKDLYFDDGYYAYSQLPSLCIDKIMDYIDLGHNSIE